ncbi:MAG: hypothetical protein MUP04_03150 [Anaerolineae bacterium]|nr:hypothetical protein [Anaerolineae bacterium]
MYIFKGHNLGLISLILLLAMAVSCRGETPPLATPPVSRPSPTRTTPTLQPTPSPTKAIVTPTRISQTPCPSSGSIEEQAREALADFMGISSGEVKVIEVEEVEWPDTSLGCPQPGMAYLQVIVPGWRVVMRAANKVYEYHYGGGQGVLCDQQGNFISVLPSLTVTPITAPSVPTPTREDVCPMMPVFPHGRACPTPWTPDD